MKHFLTIFFLAITLSSIAKAQECTVPISVQVRNATTHEVKKRQDKSSINLVQLLERHGFTTEVSNTCVAICLVSTVDKEYCGESKMRGSNDTWTRW